jgi:radical SAM superfamily enzyme YgiQ (UPF0313 family)
MAAGRTPGRHLGKLGNAKMRILLISGNREDIDIRVPALGLACIAAASENAGHEVRLMDLMIEENPQAAIVRVVQDFQPEAIGVSVRNIDDQRRHNTRFLLDQAREAVKWCRNCSKVPIILGGAGFSILPQAILDYLAADMGIQGEGETIFPKLLSRLQAGTKTDDLPGVFYRNGIPSVKRTFVKNLDSLPLPNPSLLARSLTGAKNAPVPVQTRRGCPMACSYCSTPTIEGNTVRWRDPERVVLWLRRWVEEGFRQFYFVDNTFNLPPSYAMHLCSKIIAANLNISWRCILYPGALDEKLIKTMARAGCREVSVGFESGSETILHNMNKKYSLKEVQRACTLLRRFEIRSMGFLLLGGPGETRETIERSFEFADALDIDALKISIGIRIYPDSDLARRAKEKGLISSENDLLMPCFYLNPALESRVLETVEMQISSHPTWTF